MIDYLLQLIAYQLLILTNNIVNSKQMSGIIKHNFTRSPKGTQSFDTQQRRKSRKNTTTSVDQDFQTRSFSSQLRRTNLVLMKKKSNNTVINKRIQLNLSTIIKDYSPIATPEFNGSYTERKPLIEKDEDDYDELKYSIKITPPKDIVIREKSQVRPRGETDYMKTKELKKKHQTPQRQFAKSDTDSIYNESAIKIRNQKRQRNPISSFTQPIRKSISPLRSNQTIFANVEKIINKLRYNGGKFQDPLYPANNSLVFNMPRRRNLPSIKFQRLHKIYSRSNFKLMRQCDAMNLVLGKFSSKRVHCSLQILSEQPVRIMNILHQQDVNSEGIYYVQLCQDGVWRYIVIDDFLPIKQDSKVHLLFEHIISDNDEYQLWPALIEKAICKIYGTYQDVQMRQNEGLLPIFRMLTGYPCSEYKIEADLKTYSIIMESSLKQRYIVVLQCLNQVSESQLQLFKNLNLSPSQSYQIIKIQDNIIVLRNYEEQVFIDAQYQFQQMSIFDRLLIFKPHDGYTYQSITLKHRFQSYSHVEITVQKQTYGFFDLWQKNAAYFKTHISGLDYAPAPFLIQLYDKCKPDEVLYIRESGIPVGLEAGVHVVKIHLCEEWELDFTLSFYGESEVEMKRIKVIQKWPEMCCQ